MFGDLIFYPITAYFPPTSLEFFCLTTRIYCKCQDDFYLSLTMDQQDCFLFNYQGVCKLDVDTLTKSQIIQNSTAVRKVELAY